MSEEIRKLVRKINKSVVGFLSAPRQETRLTVLATLDSDRQTGDLRKAGKPIMLEGYTQDLSKTGVAFVVPFIRLGEYYFAGDGQCLILEIELPESTIKMNVIAQRYEILGQHDSVSAYLIGAKIVTMKPEDRETLENYLKYGSKNQRKKKEKTISTDLQTTESGGSVIS